MRRTCPQEAAKRLEQMVERFETLAQNKKSFFSQEDLSKIVQGILEMLHGAFERRRVHLVTGFHPVSYTHLTLPTILRV